MIKSMNIHKGFTLLELCIASALASLLLCLLLQSYVSALQTYAYQCAVSRLQQQHFFFMSYFKHMLSLAGDAGCYTANTIAVRVYPDGSAGLPGYLQAKILPHTDVLDITYLDSRLDVIEPSTHSAIVTLGLAGLHDLHGTPWWIADCLHGEYFYVKKKQAQTSTITWSTLTPLKYDYDLGATVGQWRQAFFYIAKTGRQDVMHRPIHGLYRYDTQTNAVELEEGIDALDLRVAYCDKPDRFVLPENGDDMRSVCFLKMRTVFNSHLIMPMQHTKGLTKTWEGIFAVNH